MTSSTTSNPFHLSRRDADSFAPTKDDTELTWFGRLLVFGVASEDEENPEDQAPAPRKTEFGSFFSNSTMH